MRNTFNKIWNFEIQYGKNWLTNTQLIKPFIWIVAIGYAFFVVMIFSEISGSTSVNAFNILELIQQYESNNFSLTNIREFLPYVWIAVAIFAVITRSIITIHSYYLSVKEIGEEKFNKYFSTFILTFLIGSTTMVILSVIGWFLSFENFNADWMNSLINNGVTKFNGLIKSILPFSLNSDNYILSLIASILIAYFPGYIVHNLCHRTRLLWLLAHRPHHCPDFLFPLAAPNNNLAILEYLMAIPGAIFFIAISGMIYHEPLTIELAIWFTLCFSLESINHSIVHYDMALKNPIIKNFTTFFGGNGVYHLVHHSAKKQDQNVNLGGGPFLIWDRIFGTYRKPYEVVMPIGLTNQPKINMSPLNIVFNGFSQIWYELKMNRNWKIRFKIIFGDVNYKPPITKDFLILSECFNPI